MSWLDELLKQTEESEAPERYFWWSGLAAISAVVRKNIWLDKFNYKLYPNIYVALISTKSGARKGEPIRICKSILEETYSARIISGTNTIQGIIEELGKQKTFEKGGLVISDAHAILLSSEFKNLLIDPNGFDVLTELYGTHENEKFWEKTLKNSPKSTLKSPCLSMLVASNEVMFDTIVKSKDIQGGFIGRFMVVRESGIRKLNSLVRPPKNRLNIPELAIRLVEISKIKGEFKYGEKADDLYDEWYNRTFDPEQDHEDRTGTFNRLQDSVLKVAMLLSLARKDELVLDWSDIEIAIAKCSECAETAARITSGVEASNGDRPNYMKFVMDCLAYAPRHTITKAQMLRKLQQYQIYTNHIDSCITQLISAGWVSKHMVFSESSNPNDRIIFSLTDEGKKQYHVR